MKKYIFLDIDNTLLIPEKGIPESAIFAIEKARNNGHKVFVCTGRASSDMDSSLHKIEFDGYIYSCGAKVIVDHTTIYQSCLPYDDTKLLLKKMIDVNIAFNLEGLNDSFLNSKGWNAFKDLIKHAYPSQDEQDTYMRSIHMRTIDKLNDDYLRQIVKICVFERTDQFYDSVVKKLSSNYHYSEHSLGEKNIFGEISLASVNKATGIQNILNHFDDTKEKTIGIGDSSNDISMIQFCDIGICVGNGSDGLKEISDYVGEDIDNDGLFKIFDHFGLVSS